MSAATATRPPDTPPLLKRLVVSHPLSAFFVLAFVGGWTVLLPTVLFESGFGLVPIDIPAPVVMLFFIPAAMAGPTLAAFVVSGVVEGKEGIRKLLRRHVLRWRVGVQWYSSPSSGFLPAVLPTSLHESLPSTGPASVLERAYPRPPTYPDGGVRCIPQMDHFDLNHRTS